MRVQR